MINYALINDENRQQGYRQYSKEVNSPELIEITEEQYGNLDGFQWDGTDWIDPRSKSLGLNLVVTSISPTSGSIDFSSGSVDLAMGTRTAISVEIQRDDGSVIPLTKTFVLPIAGLYGTPAKIKTVEFNKGKATFLVNWKHEGIYEVTEQHVNRSVDDPSKFFSFKRIEFKVEDKD